MRRQLASLASAALALVCFIAHPSTSFAQGGFNPGRSPLSNMGATRNIGGFPRYGPGGAFFGSWNGSPFSQYYYSTPVYSSRYWAVPASAYQSLYPTMPQPVDLSHAYIHVVVAANAKVLFDNTPTQQTGPQRDFVSPQLEPNQQYCYEVTAEWTLDGRPHRETRTVRVIPGQRTDVNFLMPPADSNGVR